jgi:hypothetical protein
MSENGRSKRRGKPDGQPAKRPMSREDFLQRAFSAVNEELSAAARQNLRANFELQYDYPAEYVVFLDDWEGAGRGRRLKRRVLGHGPRTEIKALSDLVASLSLKDQMRVQFLFIEDPFTEEIPL